MIAPLKIRGRTFSWKENTYFMGILNVTPDSFSDGGKFLSLESAVLQAKKLLEDGADIIDVGGESTRPFSDRVPLEEELKRVIPVIKAIRENFPGAIISVDTYKAKVAEEAIKAGADIVNDISALRFDPSMLDVVKEAKVPVVIMHMKGEPKTMQLNPEYEDVVKEVHDFLRERIEFLVEKGIEFDKIIVDPGIGFGKKFEHNIKLIKNIDFFLKLNRPILLGHSRKTFIGELIQREPHQRDGGTVGVSLFAALKGVHILRVHEVRLNKDAIKVFKYLYSQGES
ncbi:MAG: dihydropteroate synthase [Thermodesulfobacteria bacterium]|nr:dihydropteroate synthase [Thermodesulfobacteriota bacterium]